MARSSSFNVFGSVGGFSAFAERWLVCVGGLRAAIVARYLSSIRISRQVNVHFSFRAILRYVCRVNAPATTLDLAAALVVLPGARAAIAEGSGSRDVRPPSARELFEAGPVLLAHAAMTARRLGLHAPPRAAGLFDVLELFAFTRPAQFCAPSAVGLALATGLAEPKGAAAQATALREVSALLLAELASAPTPSREEALAQAGTLGRASPT